MNLQHKPLSVKASQVFSENMNRTAFTPAKLFEGFGYFSQGTKRSQFWMSSGFYNYKHDKVNLAYVTQGNKLPARPKDGIVLQQMTPHALSQFVRSLRLYHKSYALADGSTVRIQDLLSEVLSFAHSCQRQLVISAGYGASRISYVEELIIELHSRDVVRPDHQHCARFTFSDLQLVSPLSGRKAMESLFIR